MIIDTNTIPTGKVFECKEYPFVYRDKEGKSKYDSKVIPYVDFISIRDINGYLHCRKSTLYLSDKIDNKYIIPRFAEMRIKCNKKCLKGSHCRRCDNIKDLSITLENKKIIIEREKI